jgi:hypothetical protein
MHQSATATQRGQTPGGSGFAGPAADLDRLLDSDLDCIVTMDARGRVIG